jgi:hypothetical protein
MDPFMMKRFNRWVVMVVFISGVGAAQASMQARSMNDDQRDMLQDTVPDENQNEDAASRWGKSGSKMRAQQVKVAKPVAAISESSFQNSGNRAPASVRSPAGVATEAPKKKLPPAKTMVRVMREKKAHQEAAVIVNDLGFYPSTLFFTQGIPVRLFVTGASQRSQCMIMDAFGVRRQIRSNKVEEIIFTPDQTGKFAFSCPMNGARGTVIVKALEIAERLPASEQPVVESASHEESVENESEISESDFGVEFRQKH